MNKTELIEELAERTGSTRQEDRRRVKALAAATLSGGNDIRILDFGKYYVQQREAHEGTNPERKRKVHVPASKVPKFKKGNVLKRAV